MISVRVRSLELMKELNTLISSGVVRPEYISPIIRRFQRSGDTDELYSMLMNMPIEQDTEDANEILGTVLAQVKNGGKKYAHTN